MANKILYINNVKCMNVESRENLRRCAYEAFKNNESGYAVSRKLKVRESTVYRWYKEFKTKVKQRFQNQNEVLMSLNMQHCQKKSVIN